MSAQDIHTCTRHTCTRHTCILYLFLAWQQAPRIHGPESLHAAGAKLRGPVLQYLHPHPTASARESSGPEERDPFTRYRDSACEKETCQSLVVRAGFGRSSVQRGAHAEDTIPPLSTPHMPLGTGNSATPELPRSFVAGTSLSFKIWHYIVLAPLLSLAYAESTWEQRQGGPPRCMAVVGQYLHAMETFCPPLVGQFKPSLSSCLTSSHPLLAWSRWGPSYITPD